jgi:hypothetical protein
MRVARLTVAVLSCLAALPVAYGILSLRGCSGVPSSASALGELLDGREERGEVCVGLYVSSWPVTVVDSVVCQGELVHYLAGARKVEYTGFAGDTLVALKLRDSKGEEGLAVFNRAPAGRDPKRYTRYDGHTELPYDQLVRLEPNRVVVCEPTGRGDTSMQEIPAGCFRDLLQHICRAEQHKDGRIKGYLCAGSKWFVLDDSVYVSSQCQFVPWLCTESVTAMARGGFTRYEMMHDTTYNCIEGGPRSMKCGWGL